MFYISNETASEKSFNCHGNMLDSDFNVLFFPLMANNCVLGKVLPVKLLFDVQGE